MRMNNWAEEFIRIHNNNTKRVSVVTKQFNKVNPEEAKRIRKILSRFDK